MNHRTERRTDQAWRRQFDERDWIDAAEGREMAVPPDEALQQGQSWLGVLVVMLVAAAAVASWLSPLLPS